VRNDGTVLDPNGIAVAVTGADEAAPAVSWNGTNWLVAWKRDGGTVIASRIAVHGEVLDPSGIPIAVMGGWLRAAGLVMHYTPGDESSIRDALRRESPDPAIRNAVRSE
jgi:hypothetical protein